MVNLELTYINYKGQKYYLHERRNKKDNPVYHFSLSDNGNIIEYIPKGYEIYEMPNGEVYLRKIQRKIIKDEEVLIVKNSINPELDYKIDVKKNIITIYLKTECNYYFEYMRFILEDEKTRLFSAERYCFRGSVDGWLELGQSLDFELLVKKCCVHLGEDTFYDLPYGIDGWVDDIEYVYKE